MTTVLICRNAPTDSCHNLTAPMPRYTKTNFTHSTLHMCSQKFRQPASSCFYSVLFGRVMTDEHLIVVLHLYISWLQCCHLMTSHSTSRFNSISKTDHPMLAPRVVTAKVFVILSGSFTSQPDISTISDSRGIHSPCCLEPGCVIIYTVPPLLRHCTDMPGERANHYIIVHPLKYIPSHWDCIFQLFYMLLICVTCYLILICVTCYLYVYVVNYIVLWQF